MKDINILIILGAIATATFYFTFEDMIKNAFTAFLKRIRR